MSETEQVIHDMLTENTGSHILDSGYAYGRNWERNQDVDFAAQPYGHVSFDTQDERLEIDYTINIYPWLVERVTYDPALSARLRTFGEAREGESWASSMAAFADEINASEVYYGSTYGDCLLSTALQYLDFCDEDEGQHYAFLQIHGGCDLRGGYTRPRAFRIGECGLDGFADASLYAEGPDGDASWHTDDGMHWFLGCCTPQLTLFPKDYDGGRQLQDYPVTSDPRLAGKGYVYIGEDDIARCPATGGRLTI